ncbi:MAG: phosphotransferase [Kofleriaceae bacterium]
MIPAAVVAAYGWDDAELHAVTGGLINATYRVTRGAPIAAVQRLHKIFGAEVNLDIEAVTAHLAARGMTTPRLIRTLDDRAWVEVDGEIWRALTWLDGRTVHAVPEPAWAEAGGELVGRFHRAVADLQHDYAFARAGVHDTAAHLARLADFVVASADAEAVELGRDVLAAAAGLPELVTTRRRHCHGDLKISNLVFGEPLHGLALVDLDTLGLGTLAFELGDAMRSWCNPSGEDAGSVLFDLPIFAAAIRGFRSVADPIVTPGERASIVSGLETVCIELAARFAVDVFRDDYFGWDPARFPSRRAHNLIRARGQLTLALAVRAARSDALDLVLTGS